MNEILDKYNKSVQAISATVPMALESISVVVRALVQEIEAQRKEIEALNGKIKSMEQKNDTEA